MRTILDVTVCTHSRGGVGRWVTGLSLGLQHANSHHLSLDVPETHPGLRSAVPGITVLPTPPWMKIPVLRRFLLKNGLLESTRSSRINKIAGMPDIIHLSGVQPEGAGRHRVVTFFDDTPWTAPESHTEQTLFYADRLRNLVVSGASVLTISRWSADVACRLFDIPRERVGNAGGAADALFSPGEPESSLLLKYNLTPGGYFLHVGSYVPRKNIPFLVSCFNQAVTGKKLVLAGAEKWGDPVTENTPGVVLLSNIKDTELLSLYRGACAVLLPSSTEGLGLPVLEAFACHTPVIASDGGALPETVGRNGLVLPVLEKQAWVRSLREIADGTTGEALRLMSESAPRPTFHQVGDDAMSFYRSLL